MNGAAMVVSFQCLVESYCSYAQHVFPCFPQMSNQRVSITSWAKPSRGVIKVNVDAHVMKGEYVSLGVVCRDERGVVLLTATKKILVDWDPTLAEAATTRYGLQVGQRSGFNNICLESDALNVVKAIEDDA